MKCPDCGERTPDAWNDFQAVEPAEGGGSHVLAEVQAGFGPFKRQVALDWMRCANEDCGQLVIRMHESFMAYEEGLSVGHTEESFLVRPRFAMARAVAPEVPEDLRRDYGEAVSILYESPRMSGVLSRRILADLLERYAKRTDFSLKARIDAFAADTSHPHGLRANLDYLAEIGNFGAHTQTNDQADIIDVGQEEAEWTLTLVERLFDYFIVTPEKDRKMRAAFDEKLKEANRNPIVPPLEEELS